MRLMDDKSNPWISGQTAYRRASAAADVARHVTTPPTADELAASPLLDDYAEEDLGDVVIVHGSVTEHARVPDGPMGTSYVCARGDGWMRTVGLIYRLGRPLARDASPALGR